MTPLPLDPQIEGEIINAVQKGSTYTEAAQKFNTTRNAVAGILRRWKERVCEYNPLTLVPLHLEGDFMIAGDIHVPCTDWEWARRVVVVAQRLKINRLIVAGDFFNMDAFSTFAATMPPAQWAQERDAARVLINDWLDWFEDVYILMGNHDRRLEKWAGGNLDEQDIFGMVTTSRQVHVSQFSWCMLTSKGTPWRITHPKNYGRNQLTVASDLANKYSANIISFHEHHLSKGYDVYGRWVIVNGGTLVDPAKLGYVELEDNRMAGMVRGFVAVKGGCVSLYGETPFSDWTCA